MTELEPEPSAAEPLFGDRIGTARAFTASLPTARSEGSSDRWNCRACGRVTS